MVMGMAALTRFWFSGLESRQFSDAAGNLFPLITVTRMGEITEWPTHLADTARCLFNIHSSFCQ